MARILFRQRDLGSKQGMRRLFANNQPLARSLNTSQKKNAFCNALQNEASKGAVTESGFRKVLHDLRTGKVEGISKNTGAAINLAAKETKFFSASSRDNPNVAAGILSADSKHAGRPSAGPKRQLPSDIRDKLPKIYKRISADSRLSNPFGKTVIVSKLGNPDRNPTRKIAGVVSAKETGTADQVFSSQAEKNSSYSTNPRESNFMNEAKKRFSRYIEKPDQK